MLNGLDLFSGYGGISLALRDWVRPVAYCENDRYAQAILLSRMAEGGLPSAPIWDDVRTFEGHPWRSRVDIIYGGFPCQDISLAGAGKGLAGKRSGLFFEVMRLAEEIEPTFLFLENVPAIRTRGLREVTRALSNAGYDSRWTSISAQEVGAPHKRERWFLLASNPDSLALWNEQQRESWRLSNGVPNERKAEPRVDGLKEPLANPASERSDQGITELQGLGWKGKPDESSESDRDDPWKLEPGICRVVNEFTTIMDVSLSGELIEGLRILRCCDCKAALGEWETRVTKHLQEEDLLQSKLLRECSTCKRQLFKEVGKKACAEGLSNGIVLRSMWSFRGKTFEESHRREYEEQRSKQHLNMLLAMPRKIGLDLGNLGASCSRVSRIRALGNGVVPLQAREAFKELMGLS